MLVSERMTPNPVTVPVGASARQAMDIMAAHKVRHLPVVDEAGRLVGILAERDLFRAGDDEAVRQVMTTPVVTVTEYTALEEAARILADHKVSSLPVMRGSKLVGIITQTDLFKIFVELLAAREKGLRLTLLVPEEPGMLAAMTGEIAQMGGNILALSTFLGEDPTNRTITVKVSGVRREKLVAVMEALGMEIVDVREG